MSKASMRFVENLKAENSPLLESLREMSAYEQALSRPQSYYHYPLNGTREFAKQKNLIRERDDGLVRLSPWGREVAYAACTL